VAEAPKNFANPDEVISFPGITESLLENCRIDGCTHGAGSGLALVN
jgi:hypothetical protein